MTRILARSAVALRSRRVRAFAIDEKTPPPEVQLWSAGDNPTDYGVHKWTARSVAEVVAVYEERGNPILIDIEHNASTLDDGEPAETAGYARLDIRNGEPWLVFDWSATGAAQIASGQRRFLSPEYDVDPATNEITRLYRVSLVADPATHRARILASAAQERNNMDPKLAAILAILEGVSDPAEAIASIKNAISTIEGDPTPAADPVVDAPADAVPAFASAVDKDDDKEKKVAAAAAEPVAAAAPAETVKVAASASVESEAVRASRESAERVERSERNVLLEAHGHRLQPSIRKWASTQPVSVVRGLIAAAPEALPAPTHVTATRGAGHGNGGPVRKGLEGAELEEFQKRMGTFKASTSALPHRNEAGHLVLPTTPPREAARILAAQTKEGAR